MEMSGLIEILHSEKCSCVIYNSGEISMYYKRGVKDLYDLLLDNPARLRGAMVADKVIGKGAAAILAEGEVSSLYADVMSKPALHLLGKMPGISVAYGKLVDNIINRSKTGLCPVEQLCLECAAPKECVDAIGNFLNAK